MRQIHTHKINGCNGQLTITVEDEPGPGGVNHFYRIRGFDTASNPSAVDADGYRSSFASSPIVFQNGLFGPGNTPNGITNEVLLAILIDRLQGFQRGPFACRENAIALTKLEEAMLWLNKRTADRVARGVEGTHTV